MNDENRGGEIDIGDAARTSDNPAPGVAVTRPSPRTGLQAEIPARSTATFRQLTSIREFRAFLAGFALFCLASPMVVLPTSVLVYERSRSATLSGAVIAGNYLPYVFGTMFLLALADRIPARRGLVGVGLVQTAVASVLATDVLPPAGAVALVMLGGLVWPIGTAIRSAVLPDLLPDEQYVLGRAVFNMTSYVTQAAGYALSGGLAAIIGPVKTLWAAAALLLVAVSVNRFGLSERAAKGKPVESVVISTLRTNRRLWQERKIRGVVLAHWLPISMIMGAEGVFVPFAAQRGGTASASLLFWAVAAGNLVGDLVVGRFASSRMQERLSLPLAMLFAAPLVIFGANPPIYVAVALCFASGLGVAYTLGLQRRLLDAVPAPVRGQAFGLIYNGISTLQGAAALVAGAAAEHVDPRWVIAVFGVGSLLSSLALAKFLLPQGSALSSEKSE